MADSDGVFLQKQLTAICYKLFSQSPIFHVWRDSEYVSVGWHCSGGCEGRGGEIGGYCFSWEANCLMFMLYASHRLLECRGKVASFRVFGYCLLYFIIEIALRMKFSVSTNFLIISSFEHNFLEDTCSSKVLSCERSRLPSLSLFEDLEKRDHFFEIKRAN